MREWTLIQAAARRIARLCAAALEAYDHEADATGHDPWTEPYHEPAAVIYAKTLSPTYLSKVSAAFTTVAAMMDDEEGVPLPAAHDWGIVRSYLRLAGASMSATPHDGPVDTIVKAVTPAVMRVDELAALGSRSGFEVLQHACLTVAGLAAVEAEEDSVDLVDRVEALEDTIQAIHSVTRGDPPTP